MSEGDSLEALRHRMQVFVRERDWEQYHSPKNLCMAMMVEAAELAEHFQWLREDESAQLDDRQREAVSHELADVLLYLIRLSDRLGIDLVSAANEKMKINAAKYPVEKVRGSARKYTHYT